MQTFLPSTSFEQSAEWLDTKRLGKQRVECLQILRALTNPDYGWQSHPAVEMWRGYECALARYGLKICEEWIKRGYKDTCFQKIVDVFDGIVPYQENPPWLTEEFASNHRAILLGKVFEKLGEAWYDLRYIKQVEWYQQWNWQEQPAQRVSGKWPYLWPEVDGQFCDLVKDTRGKCIRG